MYKLIYTGTFYSRRNTRWDISILRQQEEDPETVGELRFPGDEPLLIEWDERSREEVICSSTATLRVLSPEDGTYMGLYTESAGAVRMEVMKNGKPYWQGTLDTEFYEEPYTWTEDYEVSLTFSDFGPLDRLNYTLDGWQTVADIVGHCIAACGLTLAVDETNISTKFEDGSALRLASLSLQSDNFYDEDGEAETLEEVLEGVLQPLALRIVQRGGRCYVYDLNGLYNRTPITEKIEWMSDDQMLGVDRVYNNAKVTFSPYQRSGVLSPTGCWTEETDPGVTALNNTDGKTHGNCTVYTFHANQDIDSATWGRDDSDFGFSIWMSEVGKLEINPRCRFFKIIPYGDGQEAEGMAIRWVSCNQYHTDAGNSLRLVTHGTAATAYNPGEGVGAALFKFERLWIPPVAAPDKLRVRITLEMLMDCRINPFEKAKNMFNDFGFDIADDEKRWKDYMNFVYVPVTVKFQPDGSDEVYVWVNGLEGSDVVNLPVGAPVVTLEGSLGRWMRFSGDNARAWGFLAYYNPDDRADDCGVMGWKKNRQAINPHTKPLMASLADAQDGQVIPYPNFGGKGGRLWIEPHRGGWHIAEGGKTIDLNKKSDSHNCLRYGGTDRLKWLLMKMPEISIEKAQPYDTAIGTDDIEYQGEVNPEAKDELELDTICGTSGEDLPTARGTYYRTEGLQQVHRLQRNGRTAQAEDLLIGTLYSQFAERKVKLTGTAALPEPTLTLYREATFGNSLKLLLTACSEDIQQELAECTFVEIKRDNYEPRE